MVARIPKSPVTFRPDKSHLHYYADGCDNNLCPFWGHISVLFFGLVNPRLWDAQCARVFASLCSAALCSYIIPAP